MTRQVLVSILGILLVGGAYGANAIHVIDTTAQPGALDVPVTITIDNDEPLWAVSFAARYPTALTFKAITIVGTDFGSTGVNAEFFQPLTGAGYFGAALIVDYADSTPPADPYTERTLPAGTGHTAFKVTFDVSPAALCGDVLAIDLRNDLGNPAIKPVFTVAPVGTISESRTPTLDDGNVTIAVPVTVTQVSPSAGKPAGGDNVTIRGTGFSADSQVTFGGTAITNKVVVNSTTITGKTPAHAAGAVAVRVFGACGDATLAGAFTYTSGLMITAFQPKWGATASDTAVAISGSDFTAATSITFGGIAIRNKAFVNANLITGNAPAHAAGPVDVVASDGGNTFTATEKFTYVNPPTVTEVTPSSGMGDRSVMIFGTNFTDDTDTVVLVGLEQITPITVVDSTSIQFHIPACGDFSGWVSVSVFTAGGSATLEEAYSCGSAKMFRRGDANCDGDHNIADVIKILGYLFAKEVVKCEASLDSNDDNGINIADAIYMLTYLFAKGPEPKAPFSTLGTDPTGNVIPCATQCDG